jgi:hypothetical protein
MRAAVIEKVWALEQVALRRVGDPLGWGSRGHGMFWGGQRCGTFVLRA